MGVVLFILILVLMSGCSSSDYNKAVRLFEKGEYKEANSIFKDLSDYKDSEEYVRECRAHLAALEVENAIEDITLDLSDDTSILDADSAISHARSEYEDLSEEGKLYVSNYDKLVDYEAEIAEIKPQLVYSKLRNIAETEGTLMDGMYVYDYYENIDNTYSEYKTRNIYGLTYQPGNDYVSLTNVNLTEWNESYSNYFNNGTTIVSLEINEGLRSPYTGTYISGTDYAIYEIFPSEYDAMEEKDPVVSSFSSLEDVNRFLFHANVFSIILNASEHLLKPNNLSFGDLGFTKYVNY